MVWEGCARMPALAGGRVGGPRLRVALASPLRRIVEAAQLLARVAGQRVDQNLLRFLVLAVLGLSGQWIFQRLFGAVAD